MNISGHSDSGQKATVPRRPATKASAPWRGVTPSCGAFMPKLAQTRGREQLKDISQNTRDT